jgi:hypothetical protein
MKYKFGAGGGGVQTVKIPNADDFGNSAGQLARRKETKQTRLCDSMSVGDCTARRSEEQQ